MDNRLARGRRWFEYHCYEGEDSSDAELWHHTHQRVKVLEKTQEGKPNSSDEIRMYLVKFPDGSEFEVFDDELIKSPSEFYRPDYKRRR